MSQPLTFSNFIKDQLEYQSLRSELYDLTLSALKRPIQVAIVHQAALLINSKEKLQSLATSLWNPTTFFKAVVEGDYSLTRLFAGGLTYVLFQVLSKVIGTLLHYFFLTVGVKEFNHAGLLANAITLVITYPLLGVSHVQALTGQTLVEVWKGKTAKSILSLWSGFIPHYVSGFLMAEYAETHKNDIIFGGFFKRLLVMIPAEVLNVVFDVWCIIEALTNGTNGKRDYNLTVTEPWRLFAGVPLTIVDVVTDDVFGTAYDFLEAKLFPEELIDD